MVEPFTDVPVSPSALAFDTPVLLVDQKLGGWVADRPARQGARRPTSRPRRHGGIGPWAIFVTRHYPRRYIGPFGGGADR